MSSRWIRCISQHGNIRAVAIEATDLVRESAALHQMRGESAKGLAEALMGAMLIGSYSKPGERINLNIQGSTRFKQALVDAHPDGKVRGYVVERENFLDVPETLGPWGAGFISVLRTQNGEGQQPYIGTVPILTGHLAKDLTFYWVQSEQIPTAIGLFIGLKGEEIEYANAFMVQAMPGATPEEVRLIEENVEHMEKIEECFKPNSDPMKTLSHILQDSTFMVMDERPVQLDCNCSRDRVTRALALVGVQELQAMLLEDKQAMIRCDFCTKEYRFDEAGLQTLIDQVKT